MKEGSQYDWCKTNVTKGASATSTSSYTNDAIKNMNHPRSGEKEGAEEGGRVSLWWMRSPDIFNSECFTSVYSSGMASYASMASGSCGVVPAFAMGLAKHTVTFNATDGAFSDGTTSTTQTVLDGNYASAPTPAPTYTGYTLEGWYTSTDGGKTLSEEAYDFENTAVEGDFTLYAKWTETPSGYFLAKAGLDNDTLTKLALGKATDAEKKTYGFVSQAQIEADIATLSGEDSDEKTTVTNTWTAYMNSDVISTGSTDAIHLYTNWNGEDYVTANTTDDDTMNKWLECRIVQVGEHDGDGSAVTFMATHSLPTAQQMNTTVTNDDGWGGSAMRGLMNSYVAANMPKGFTDALNTVTKKAISGKYENWNENGTTQDSIWLMSYSELTGNTIPDGAGNEGSQ